MWRENVSIFTNRIHALSTRLHSDVKVQWTLIQAAYDTFIGRSIVFVVVCSTLTSLAVNYFMYIDRHWLDGVDVYSVTITGDHAEELTENINAVLRKSHSFVPKKPCTLKLNARWVYNQYTSGYVQRILIESPDDPRFFVSFTADQIGHRPADVKNFSDYTAGQVAAALRENSSRKATLRQ